MTTSLPTTRSPSSRSTTRSTPCVLGCCGPMLRTSSSVSNMGCGSVAINTPAHDHGTGGTETPRKSLYRSSFSVPRCLLFVIGERCSSLDFRLGRRLFQLQPVQRALHQQL